MFDCSSKGHHFYMKMFACLHVGATFIGKNLLSYREQILSYKSSPLAEGVCISGKQILFGKKKDCFFFYFEKNGNQSMEV